jgi:hypothetical protein
MTNNDRSQPTLAPTPSWSDIGAVVLILFAAFAMTRTGKLVLTVALAAGLYTLTI